MSERLEQLREIPISHIHLLGTLPEPRIKTDDDVDKWKTTRSYRDYGVFLRRLNESVVDHSLLSTPENLSVSITSMITALDTLDAWIDEIPPFETPQRFGNLAFRTWGKRLEERADEVLGSLLTSEYSSAIPFVKPYLLTSFGSFTRMDYGTGHEASFALFMLCLTLIRFFKPMEEEERSLVLAVFLRYLRLCWRLQDVYRLEPAGSHGVWGLDDYCFLPYIFGSGQLRDQAETPVSAVLHPPLPPTNLYFMAITRIHSVKQGPFFEHSSQLHSIAVGVPNWGKVNLGLFKMYEAEVLGKRVVVQHIPLGGILEWDTSGKTSDEPSMKTADVMNVNATTRAPWASNPPTSIPNFGVSVPSTTVPSRTNRPGAKVPPSAIGSKQTNIGYPNPSSRTRNTMGPPDPPLT